MTIFASKDAFMALGLEQVNPSAAHASQDCAVCTKPLAVHDRTISTHVTLKDYHPTSTAKNASRRGSTSATHAPFAAASCSNFPVIRSHSGTSTTSSGHLVESMERRAS
jgi:hypothetical protein